MTAFLDEAQVEIATVGFFQELGDGYEPGPHTAPGEPSAERRSFLDIVLLASDLSLPAWQAIIGVEAS